MQGNGSLSPKQNALLALLIAGEQIEKAAAAVKISPSTAYRWQKQASFQEKLEAGKDAVFTKKLGMLKEGFGTALLTLLRNMKDPAPAGVQVAAARAWIDTTITIHYSEELEDSIAELQPLLKGSYVTLQ